MVLAALGPMLVVAVVELALASTKRPGWPAVASGFESALKLLPWSNDPDFRTFGTLMAIARRPQVDLRVESDLARQSRLASSRTFAQERFSIYRRELAETGLILLSLLTLAPFSGRRPVFATALVVLTAVDLWHLGHHREFDLGPIRPLAAQSPVLARLARAPHGTRVADASRNLPMVVGSAPVSAYRTLDLPALGSLTSLARATLEDGSRLDDNVAIVAALRATGTGVRMLDPFERREHASFGNLGSGPSHLETPLRPPLPGWSRARRSGIRPWPAGSTGRTGLPAKDPGPRRSPSGVLRLRHSEPGSFP